MYPGSSRSTEMMFLKGDIVVLFSRKTTTPNDGFVVAPVNYADN